MNELTDAAIERRFWGRNRKRRYVGHAFKAVEFLVYLIFFRPRQFKLDAKLLILRLQNYYFRFRLGQSLARLGKSPEVFEQGVKEVHALKATPTSLEAQTK